ncbi:MAG TPA: ATP-binding cassette domain-containing protein [Acidimicrobiales bacterium]|nr:ATP-binding cassette domain-containing protein [Acidimicrobiales bacterium]
MDSPAIATEQIVKHFGSVVAVAGVDLEVKRGTVFGLLGPNGAGKTTIVRMLTTILKPTSGRATVLGVDCATDPEHVRHIIGLAGQFAAVDENLTGHENLRMVGRLTHLPKATIKPRADELLERFNIAQAAHRPVRTYSGGMRRRLDLAAALVHRPTVLFLDEPTTGLDPRSRNDLWTVIEDLVADGTTVLLTTQYLEEADRLAHEIAVIDNGEVIARGAPAELKASFGATVVEIGMVNGDAAARARTAVSAIGPTQLMLDGLTVEVKLESGPKGVTDVVRALDAADVVPARLIVREPTLDDVFLSLTGHAAEASDGDKEAGAA